MVQQIIIVLVLLFSFLIPAWAEESAEPKIEIIGKTHTIFTSNSFSGPGAEVPNLANTYDMSIFEFNLGGKQSIFNGSGITTNSNYPLTDGEALTNNTHLGISSQLTKDLRGGVLAEFYTLIGDRTVGRVFGEELPWDNFPKNNSGQRYPDRFQANFYNAFLEGHREDLFFKLVGGSLIQRELPEFTRKEMNQVKLGSLVYRAPITNASFFEKEDRKLEEGRHVMQGFDLISNFEYAEKKNIHFELFYGKSKPTPISDIERGSFGGRTAVDVGAANVGFTYVYSNGSRHNTNVRENQGVWALDSSYKVNDWLIPYITFARTDYERKNTGESHNGNAYVVGSLVKLPCEWELKAQYQRLEENYDLIATHKTEHYPGNSHGPSVQLTIPVADFLKLKGVLMHAQQLKVSNKSGDTLFGDSFFPSNSKAEKGTINVQRIGAEWKTSKRLTLSGYVEHAKFHQDAPTDPADIDKDVYNFYGGAALDLTKNSTLEVRQRRFLSKGDWQAMGFDSYQDITEAALSYKIDKEVRATLLYHYYNFEDKNNASQGQNDYYGHQVILEINVPF